MGLVNNLVSDERMKTTEARAKELKPLVERLVTIAKKSSLASRRLLVSRTHSEKTAEKLLDDIAPRYQERNGGYLRVVKSAKSRKRDGSSIAVIEFV